MSSQTCYLNHIPFGSFSFHDSFSSLKQAVARMKAAELAAQFAAEDAAEAEAEAE